MTVHGTKTLRETHKPSPSLPVAAEKQDSEQKDKAIVDQSGDGLSRYLSSKGCVSVSER